MRAVIVGAGSVGRTIAAGLVASGHEVTLIENRPAKMKVATVPQADWVQADAASPDALEAAGTAECDVLVAATGDDKANLVISFLAKTEFGVPRVVARVNEPRNEWLFDSTWGVDVSVSTPRLMTAIIEEAVSVGDLVRVMVFPMTGAGLYEGTIAPGAALAGVRCDAVDLPDGVVITAVVRDSQPFEPGPDRTLEAGDAIIVLTSFEAGTNDASDRLAGLRRLLRPDA